MKTPCEGRSPDSAVLVAYLQPDPRVLAAYLLGSAARDQLRPDSDLDLALLLLPGVSLGVEERCDLAAEISLTMGREVDIGLLRSDNLIYAREAVLTGHRIFVRDQTAADLAVATLLGMYAWFETERREVLDAYRCR